MTTGFCLEGWETDMDAARKRAVEQNKDLMIVYKGADWHPEQVGRPEKLLEYKPFRDKAREQFILVEQATSPAALKDNRAPVVLFADARGLPFYGFDSSLKQGFDWVVEEMKMAGERKGAVLAQVSSLEKAAPTEKKAQIDRLWSLFPREYASFSPVYESWKKEADQASKEKDKEDLFDGEDYMNKLADVFESKMVDDLTQVVSGEDAGKSSDLKLKFVSVFWQFYTRLSKLNGKDELTSESQRKEEKLVLEKLDRLIATAPGTREARFGDIVVRNVIRGIGPMIRLAANDTEEDRAAPRLKELEEMLKDPKWSLENRQLLEYMYAAKHLRNGEPGGVTELRNAMERAPWTTNAAAMSEALPRLEANRDNLPDLRRKELKGDEESKRRIKELTAFTYKFDFED